MSALILDGKKCATTIKLELKERVAALTKQPGLGTILVGDDPGSHAYVAGKHRDCAEIGINSIRIDLPDTASQKDILSAIAELNSAPECTGYIVQLPLPSQIDANTVLEAIDPEKDADGLHTLNLGRLLKGEPGPRSCTPAGVMALLAAAGVELAGKRAVVVGRSILVGQPMALMLQAANATVSIGHSRTADLTALTRQADVLVVAAGRPRMIGAEHVKPGAVVVDVGIHRLESEPGAKARLCGDVRFDEVEPIASAITPVPGGVGPMTVTLLLVNTVASWCQRCGLDQPLADLLP